MSPKSPWPEMAQFLLDYFPPAELRLHLMALDYSLHHHLPLQEGRLNTPAAVAREAALRIVERFGQRDMNRLFLRLRKERVQKHSAQVGLDELAEQWAKEGRQIQARWNQGLGDLLLAGTRALPTHKAPQPSQLLRADYGVVPFVGRADELADLDQWCGWSTPVSVRLYIGAGGSGKTRMLIEACEQQRQAQWAAGFLRRSKEPDIERLVFGAGDKLVVLDYAETQRKRITELIEVAEAKGQGRLRLVLLARNAGDWWDELGRGDGAVKEALRNGPEPLLLSSLFSSVEERPVRFAVAARAFAGAMEQPDREAPEPGDLAEDIFGQPLYLWMAALAALRGERLENSEDLLKATLEHEQSFWIQRAQEEGWEIAEKRIPKRLGPIVSGTTLLGGLPNEDTVLALIEEIGTLRSKEAEDNEPIAEMIRDLYPGTDTDPQARWVTGLQPDVLGEYLVSRHLSEKIIAIVMAEHFGRMESVLTSLTRLAQRDDDQGEWLKITFEDQERLKRCVRVAMAVALETGAPIGEVLAKKLSQLPKIEDVEELYKLCPESTIVLGDVAMVLAEEMLRQSFDQNPSKRIAILLSASRRCANINREDHALYHIREAYDLVRELDMNHENNQAQYAKTLHYYGNILATHGEHTQALQKTESAVKIQRRLNERSRKKYLPTLVTMIQDLAIRYDETGLSEGAIRYGWDSVTQSSLLAEIDYKFRPNYASNLINMANRLSKKGFNGQAKVCIEKALNIFHPLATNFPDTYQMRYASALNTMSIVCWELGDHKTALQNSKKAVNIIDSLSRYRQRQFRYDHAIFLNNYARDLHKNDETNQAIKKLEQAKNVYQELAYEIPKEHTLHLAETIANLAKLQPSFEISLQMMTDVLSAYQAEYKWNPGRFADHMPRFLSDYLYYCQKTGTDEDPTLTKRIRIMLDTVSLS